MQVAGPMKLRERQAQIDDLIAPHVEIVTAPPATWCLSAMQLIGILVRKVPKRAALIAPHLAMNFPFRRWVGIRHCCDDWCRPFCWLSLRRQHCRRVLVLCKQ